MDAERRVVLLLGAVNFVNILDFMMVMPMGPDFAVALGIPESQLGLVGGSYTAAAAVSGLVTAPLLDRLDRRVALALAMAGLFVGTLAGAFATGLGSLIAARVVAGAFGGPATAVAQAILADAIPPERRGRALGAVMGAFSVASVLGVPFGLEVAHRWGWRAPFVAVAGMGILVAGAAILTLRPMRGHLGRVERRATLRELLAVPDSTWAVVAAAGLYGSGFLFIPNIAAFFQGNLGVPRESFGALYLAGGVASFLSLRVLGRLVDRLGSAPVAAASTVGLLGVLLGCFVAELPLPPALWFVGFMTVMSGRNVSWQTLGSKMPPPPLRAGFMSLQSAVQNGAAALAAVGSTALVSSRPGGGLDGMPRLVVVAGGLALAAVGAMARIERRLPRR